MAASTTLVPVEEYLNTNYKPACDYIDGVLRPKSMPTWNHSLLQARLIVLIAQGYPEFAAGPEATVQIRTGKFLVPDLIVQERDRIQSPYPTEPVHLCVEILSPGDRLSEAIGKCEEYHEWGVETTWIIDPDERRAWEYRNGRRLQEIPTAGSLNAGAISIPCAEIFAGL
jgi:Uma2 family endonuclease